GAAGAAGGWANWIMDGGEMMTIGRGIGRLAGFDEQNRDPFWAAANEYIGIVFGFEAKVAEICRHHLISPEQGSSFVSPSGNTVIDIAGEKKYVEPCLGMSSGMSTMADGSEVNCTPYIEYKISGEAVPAEIAMTFDVYLSDDNAKYGSGDLHLYGGKKIELNRSGTPWRLYGPSIVIHRSNKVAESEQYNYACLEFTEKSFANLQNLILALHDGDNPLCNKIPTTEKKATRTGTTTEGFFDTFGVDVTTSNQGYQDASVDEENNDDDNGDSGSSGGAGAMPAFAPTES
ncbi:MAG: hypothetical protein ABIA62_08320, partial [Candidatus Woesearchaeota archaeon]